jgi:hypothetical protein
MIKGMVKNDPKVINPHCRCGLPAGSLILPNSTKNKRGSPTTSELINTTANTGKFWNTGRVPKNNINGKRINPINENLFQLFDLGETGLPDNRRTVKKMEGIVAIATITDDQTTRDVSLFRISDWAAGELPNLFINKITPIESSVKPNPQILNTSWATLEKCVLEGVFCILILP